MPGVRGGRGELSGQAVEGRSLAASPRDLEEVGQFTEGGRPFRGQELQRSLTLRHGSQWSLKEWEVGRTGLTTGPMCRQADKGQKPNLTHRRELFLS